ncbi:MAG: hypothetical protein ACXABO_18845 [Promethearchaeota archaeon]|jgi:RecA/RadA recombinase
MIFPISRINAFFKSYNPFKGIISVWGDFGVGKTAFALQTAITMSRNENKIIYLYSKPNLPIGKISNIFNNLDNLEEKIIFIQPENFNELRDISFKLEFLILKNLNKTKNHSVLIVIDSLTDLYRLELNKEKKEKNYNLNYFLNQILANLYIINETYNIEILIVNEKMLRKENDYALEIQSGGKVMEYWVSVDIKIERTEILRERKFTLIKHPEQQKMEFVTSFTEKGFR